MTAVPTKRPAPPSKKRKVLHGGGGDGGGNAAPPPSPGPPAAKKKSPLFAKPQNYYAPAAVASMSKEELMAWRKEQRRQRNRESAAKSRNQQRHRIEELEGEVDRWKAVCRDMEARLRCMERHVQFLMQWNKGGGRGVGGMAPTSPLPMVSHPASPSTSPLPQGDPGSGSPLCLSVAVPNTVTSSLPPAAHPFPPLLSDPKDSALVEEEAAAAAMSHGDAREHLTPILRQAVKITGATSNSPTDIAQQQLPLLPLLDSFVKTEGVEEAGEVVEEAGISVKGTADEPDSGTVDEKTQDAESTPQGNLDLDMSDEDGEFLDLLVDTLDTEFDPSLLL